MSGQIEFSEIDFQEIEYRNEYRHTKAVFTAFAAQSWPMLNCLRWLFDDNVWWQLFGGAYLGLVVFTVAALFIQYKSRVIITGQGLLLKRPLLKDVEIAYSEIGEVMVNKMVIRESYDDDLSAIDLSEAMRKWALDRNNCVKIKSRDGKKKISIEQSLENFEQLCDDLSVRWRLAIERYQGYARGTSLRQPDRYLKTRELLKAQREERSLKAHSSSEKAKQ